MGIGFLQTAEHSINRIAGTDCFRSLPKVIHQHTDLNYLCKQTEKGYFLEPYFHNMPYRNSFVPEINVVISQNNGQTFLNVTGRPVKSVRIFMRLWFIFLALMQLVLFIIAASYELSNIFPIFIPVIMCAFGYFLCKIATKFTFQAVVKAIQKEIV